MTEADLIVLLAEDDDGHATLIQRNLIRAGLDARFVRARDGREALNLLARRDANLHGRIVILLDIRMPELDGIEVLRRVKSEQRTSFIPVYMLTTTDDSSEVERCFQLGCNAYITKPVVYEQLVETIRRLASFLQIAAVPAVPMRSIS
jgi:CheY-like chemotaxis protein